MGLNVGITTAIWSFIPFFVAIIERILYGIGIKPYKILGMMMIVSMSILVALSDLYRDKSTKDTVIVGEHIIYQD